MQVAPSVSFDPNLVLNVVTALGVVGMWVAGLIQSRNRLEQWREIQTSLKKQQEEFSIALEKQQREFNERQREFTAALDKQQREFNERLDKLRQEFLGAFIPAPLATEQRAALIRRVDKNDIEIE